MGDVGATVDWSNALLVGVIGSLVERLLGLRNVLVIRRFG